MSDDSPYLEFVQIVCYVKVFFLSFVCVKFMHTLLGHVANRFCLSVFMVLFFYGYSQGFI